MAAARPLDADEIRALLMELGDELGEGKQHEVVVAGGALLALAGLRATTVDVDAVTRLPPAVVDAARRVADRRGLDPAWTKRPRRRLRTCRCGG